MDTLCEGSLHIILISANQLRLSILNQFFFSFSMIDLSNISTLMTPFLPIAGAGATAFGVVVGSGFAPRIGPLRAVVLALRSRIASADPFTCCTEELQRLNRLIKVFL